VTIQPTHHKDRQLRSARQVCLPLALVLIGSLVANLASAQMPTIVTVSETYTHVATDGGAGGYEAFPDVVRLGDGRLLCAFYAGYGHISTPTDALPSVNPLEVKRVQK
jgi:hypothetical protein